MPTHINNYLLGHKKSKNRIASAEEKHPGTLRPSRSTARSGTWNIPFIITTEGQKMECMPMCTVMQFATIEDCVGACHITWSTSIATLEMTAELRSLDPGISLEADDVDSDSAEEGECSPTLKARDLR